MLRESRGNISSTTGLTGAKEKSVTGAGRDSQSDCGGSKQLFLSQVPAGATGIFCALIAELSNRVSYRLADERRG